MLKVQTSEVNFENHKKFRSSFPKKYLPLRQVVSDLSTKLFEEVCKTGHFDSTRVRGLRYIGFNWDLDPRGIPTGESIVRFARQRPRVESYHAAPPSDEDLLDVKQAHEE